METSKDVKYWNDRYKKGGHSGYGSKGDLLKWKAEIINKYIDIFNPESIIELGCGDGNLGSLINGNYVGYDISREALKISKSKKLGVREELPAEPYDLALSIDVIHHITDKKDLQEHLKYLKKHKNFIIYAPVVFENPAPHRS
jgi:SAM-dependent methyltransferase